MLNYVEEEEKKPCIVWVEKKFTHAIEEHLLHNCRDYLVYKIFTMLSWHNNDVSVFFLPRPWREVLYKCCASNFDDSASLNMHAQRCCPNAPLHNTT